jgi:hypothetical protein
MLCERPKAWPKLSRNSFILCTKLAGSARRAPRRQPERYQLRRFLFSDSFGRGTPDTANVHENEARVCLRRSQRPNPVSDGL